MFNKGDKVLVRHQPDLGVCVVADPHEPTDMMMITATGMVPVGHYVRIDAGKKKNLGYHEASLRLETELEKPASGEEV